MSAQYSNALHTKLHNQSIEIKRLQAELDRATKAYERRAAQLNAERELIAEKLAAEQKKTAFYKGKFMALVAKITNISQENKTLNQVIKLAMSAERCQELRELANE